VVCIVIFCISFKKATDPEPPANIPVVVLQVAVIPQIFCERSPKSVAFPVVCVVT